MDCKSIGKTIAELRRKHKMTQHELASRLEVSDKAVSKWETGQGYPDITLFPVLSEVFGVSIDYLMLGEKKGIVIAGNMLLDIVKNIDCYPTVGMLSNILEIDYAVGGCVPNTAIDIAKIDGNVPICALGKLGMDENGRYVVSQLQKNGIDVSKISYSKDTPTSFSDVMSVKGGERTFFHKRGANADFCPTDIDIDSLNCNIFHIGYILLLDAFDKPDAKYGTVMARFLHDVQKRGIKTSIDVVSSSDAKAFGEKVIPALKYCDYVIINELECCAIWGFEARTPSGALNRQNLEAAMRKTKAAGVREKVIVHCKECSFALSDKDEIICVPSLKIPKEEIKGTVGAGDAFCAGSLYGIYSGYGDRQILEFASAAAACNLFAANSVDGMKTKKEILEVAEKYGRIE